MRLIDADALVKALNESGVPYRADVQEVLDAQPTVDAVPVVRCKDCKHCNTDWAMGKWYGSCKEWNTHSVMADWYCVNGERKDDDTERG